MNNFRIRHLSVIVITMLLALLATGVVNVQAQSPPASEVLGETVFITSPKEGETVSGIIAIKGAADFPDFFKYEVFLRSGESLIWVATVYGPVINGTLARLDTKTIADGSYQLVIRMVQSDSNYTDFLGPTITIENGLGAPEPFPEVESSPLYPPVAGALMRVQNCAGFNAEFDYVSPQGFCSSGTLWLRPKLQDQPLCSSVDIFLIADCEYRGTIIAEDGQGEGATYQFVAEPGKIYELNYPGGRRFFLNEIEGDPRDPTDTGGLDTDDPARYQASGGSMQSRPSELAAPAAPTPPPVPTQAAAAAPSTSDTQQEAESDEPLLPVSGQAGESNVPFTLVAAGLILFMVVGGVVAIYRGRKNPA